MIRRHKKFGLFFFVVAVVLGLATAAGSFQGSPAHAQTVTTPSITIATDQASVYEGGLAVFRLTLHGGQSGPIDRPGEDLGAQPNVTILSRYMTSISAAAPDSIR